MIASGEITFSKAEGDSGRAVTEEERLNELKQLAVRKKNKAVNRVKVGTLPVCVASPL